MRIRKASALTPNPGKASLRETAHRKMPFTMTVSDAALGNTRVLYCDAFPVGAGYRDINADLANTQLKNTPSTWSGFPRDCFNSAKGRLAIITSNSDTWDDSVIWGGSLRSHTLLESGDIN